MELFLSGKYRALVVKLYGELDDRVAAKLRENIDRELARTGAVNVAFDFSGVTFMDSSGIGVILGRCKVTAALGGKVFIYGAKGSADRIIKMSGISSLVTVADNLDDAMKGEAVNV